MTVPLAGLVTLLIELNDLKRVTSAGRSGSIATRLFGEAWAALVSGEPADLVAWTVTARSLAAARLGDIDREVLEAAGVDAGAATEVLRSAVEAVGAALPEAVRRRLAATFAEPPGRTSADRPAFVERLSQQPRAGITCPGKPRILLEPAENHADHCLVVAVYGVLMTSRFGADPGRVFLASLAHHFHNAGLPDSGFTGEMLLGRHLDTLMAHHDRLCLAQLSPVLRREVEDARSILPDADTADGAAFHAADALDRVLQTLQYRRAGALTREQVLGEMELVHAGPVKSFQDGVLRQAGLL